MTALLLSRHALLPLAALCVASGLGPSFHADGALAATSARVHPRVHRALQAFGAVNLIVSYERSPELGSTQEGSFEDEVEVIVDKVVEHAAKTQAATIKLFLQEAETPTPRYKSFRSLWLSNEIVVESASAELLEKLAETPGVISIREELNATLQSPRPDASARLLQSSTCTDAWSVAKVQASQAWDLGPRGEGVVVATMDTGFLGSHIALQSSFRPEYGWYDPVSNSTSPIDADGHGTHVAGIITGANGIGVAPRAQLIACRACEDVDTCRESTLKLCAEFLLCPWQGDASRTDCSKRPHIINNSWGFEPSLDVDTDNIFEDPIIAWRRADIIPIFASGNSDSVGEVCTSSVRNPSQYPAVITVGATTKGDGLYELSRAMSASSIVAKPEVTAPGVSVSSSDVRGDKVNGFFYNCRSGTSMAAPHVAGVVALMLSGKPGLTFAGVRQALISNADATSLLATGLSCVNQTALPNTAYGYGRVNALKAVTSLKLPAVVPIAPGDCASATERTCEDTMFCSWNALRRSCSAWW